MSRSVIVSEEEEERGQTTKARRRFRPARARRPAVDPAEQAQYTLPVRSHPVVIASANGHQYTNGGSATCVETAFDQLGRGDVLDALVAGVTILELDPLDDSVGVGGLPNADGVVQLDAACMHGPGRRAGGIAASAHVRTPALLAKAVMDHTDHHLLVGDDVTAFARAHGFEIVADLNSPNSREKWRAWKAKADRLQAIADPAAREAAIEQVTVDMVRAGQINANHLHGTINCSGVNATGDVASVTTTSGRAWKVPGRVGDSPILGAGLYVDNAVGAAGSTGRGEANLYNLSAFFIVEELRRGAHPKDAGLAALRRIQANTVDPRHLNTRGLPNFAVSFYILNKAGVYAGVSMYNPSGAHMFAVCDARGGRLEPLEPLLDGPADA
jgi:N4-(beta-N-acetylglucosaminyl)-L-asparaginase